MLNVAMHASCCAICKTQGNSSELYPASLNSQSFDPAVFSARRAPDRLHYRIVKCRACGLVRSDPIVSSEALEQLYTQSSLNYCDEIKNLKFTYRYYLSKLEKHNAQKWSLLEIGCGSGFFLEEALSAGYSSVRGVEPSRKAAAKATSKLRPYIICDIMHPGLFGPGQFDVICMFHVFDHITNPGELLEECSRILKPGGLILCIAHNIGSLSARFLKESSPIIDIEHTYLFGPDTMSRIFCAHGFKELEQGSVYNRYSLVYLIQILPLPKALKKWVAGLINNCFAGSIVLSVPLGNFYFIARHPN